MYQKIVASFAVPAPWSKETTFTYFNPPEAAPALPVRQTIDCIPDTGKEAEVRLQSKPPMSTFSLLIS
jgi:hypothetical protein